MQEDWLDIIRNYLFVLYIFLLVPLSIVNATDKHVTEIGIRAYRLRHYELGIVTHGPRTSRVAWDAITIGSDIIRKTALVEWKQLITEDIQSLQTSLGAMMVIIPKELNKLSSEDHKVSSHCNNISSKTVLVSGIFGS